MSEPRKPTPDRREPAPQEEGPQKEGARVVESEQLLDGLKSVLIHHEGVYYRLARTRNGKLILQK